MPLLLPLALLLISGVDPASGPEVPAVDEPLIDSRTVGCCGPFVDDPVVGSAGLLLGGLIGAAAIGGGMVGFGLYGLSNTSCGIGCGEGSAGMLFLSPAGAALGGAVGAVVGYAIANGVANDIASRPRREVVVRPPREPEDDPP